MVIYLSKIPWRLNLEEFELLLQYFVFILKEPNVVTIGQIETVAQIDYRANDRRSLNSPASSLLFRPL